MKKLLRALQLLRLPQEKIEERDEHVTLQFVSVRQPSFSLQYMHRLSATFAVDFWSTPDRLAVCELQAKKCLIEGLLSDVRPLIEELRLNIVSRDGQALLTLQKLEDNLFKVRRE